MILTRYLAAFIASFWLSYTGAWAQPADRSLSAAPLKPDVRVLIDISGSMKQNDPQNLRRPAVDLLVKLLPEESRAGIWSFGNDVQSLVPHESVTNAWRVLAQERAGTIDSRALYTNIGAALEAAAKAGRPQSDFRTSLVLLTDGVVDISKDAAVNSVEWQRIVRGLLPQLQEAGFVVHTIALSENADQELLSKLAVGTGGLAAVAKNADDLLSVFLKIFDAAAPAEQVSLEGNQFRIDPSIEEFTALIFREQNTDATRLQTPAGTALGRQDQDESLSWYESENYALATVKQPQAGEWQVLANPGPDSRVTVVSNLSLRVRELPVNVYRGQSVPVSFALQEDGQIITRAEFLGLMTFDLQLFKNDGSSLEPVWQQQVSGGEPPASGIFHVRLPKFGGAGDYRLRLAVDGKSFQREFIHNFSVRMPFRADVEGAQTTAGAPYYNLTLHANSRDVDVRRTQVVATLLTPEGRKLVRPMALTEQDHWYLRLTPRDTGRYRVFITINGTDKNDIEFNYVLDELSFYYSPERGFIKEEVAQPPAIVEIPEPEPAAPQPETEDKPSEAVEEPSATPEELVEDVAPPPAPEEPDETFNWPLALSLGLGNLLLMGGGAWLYHKKVSGEKSADEILDQFSEDKISSPPPAHDGAAAASSGVQPEPSPEDMAEPEMDALGETDVSNSSAEPEPQEDAVDEAGLDEALASIMGELDSDDEQSPATDDESFGLSEYDEDDEDKGKS